MTDAPGRRGAEPAAGDTSTQRELTLRALASGILLGALLTPCNVYSGLKIGWSFNMSIVALLLAFGFWRALGRLSLAPAWAIRESNICQTTASSAASIISGGLVAPIPALALLTGQEIPTLPLIAWVFAVSFLGIWVALYLRPALIVEAPLRFPSGMVTLETMQDIFSHGREATRRIGVLVASAGVAGLVKWLHSFVRPIPQWAPTPLLQKLTFSIDPSLLLLGFGAIIGLRTGLSLLLGAVIAWGIVSPALLAAGEVAGDGGATLFAPLVEWLIWPGVTLMVSATLTTFAHRLLAQLRTRANTRRPGRGPAIEPATAAGFAVAGLLVVVLQVWLFAISLPMALLALPLAVLLATVAARVVGETGIPPIGAIGKVSQLSFGVADPGNAVTNLMTANVAGGAAGQAADLLNDLKAGHGIGASPGRQAFAQFFGILTGSVVGVWVYLSLIPDPVNMLLTAQWPAPAAATWKAVAEVLASGFGSVPVHARVAMGLAAVLGIVLGLLENRASPRLLRWLPSATAVGLAFVIPASTSLMMCAGAVLAWLAGRVVPNLAARFAITVGAGFIAGESIVGVASALLQMAGG